MTRYFNGEIRTLTMVLGFDLTSVTTKTVDILCPDGTYDQITNANITVADATTGTITFSYTFTMPGEHIAQAKMVWAAVTRYSEPVSFFASTPLYVPPA